MNSVNAYLNGRENEGVNELDPVGVAAHRSAEMLPNFNVETV